MNPSKEVGEASGEATGIGETMEGVVTTVDAMASAVDAVEAMVMAVEMREWLEVGRSEMERTTAVHFFSRALAVQKRKTDFPPYVLPLYWPGLLPGLVQLLADCLLPHNSKAIQSGAMLSIKYLLLSLYQHGLQLLREVIHHASDQLLRLVRETDSIEVQNQAVWLLGQIAESSRPGTSHYSQWVMDFLPLLTDIARKYAAISGPTEAEISILNTAIKAFRPMYWLVENNPLYPQPSWEPLILEILPVLAGIYQEPGKRKKAQIRAGKFLHNVAWAMDGASLVESGMIGMVLETLRVGTELTAILFEALKILDGFLTRNYVHSSVDGKKMLDMGALDVFHLVLKRPDDRFELWGRVINCLQWSLNMPEIREAMLKEEGLLELVLELGLGMGLSEETKAHHSCSKELLSWYTGHCSESQVRRLMSKESLFPVLSLYLSSEDWRIWPLGVIHSGLEKSSGVNRGLLRRLLDSTGITDAIRRISFDVPQTEYHQVVKEHACNILDTYLNNPLPPPIPHNLPSIIYTRNVPY